MTLTTRRAILPAVLCLFCGLLSSPGQSQPTPTTVVGQMAYQNYLIPKYFQANPSVSLISVAASLRSPSKEFVPKSGQILGRLLTPVAPSPLKFEVPLPIAPAGDSVDLDPHGKGNRGVQVFAAILALNLFGDSYLEQLEQGSGYLSILNDPHTGGIQQGSLLIYAPDDRQKVPIGPGPDGKLFTDDDPVAPVAAGYTLMRIAPDGRVHLDRSDFRMDLLEPASVESPDFSGQGILGSYNSLLELLAERYAYTELRQIDWKQVRERFLARAAAADATNDLAGYYILLHDLAHSIHDGHVSVVAPYTLKGQYIARLAKLWSGHLGATVVHLSDDRFVVNTVGSNSPAQKAGLRPGTEILTINGKTVAQHLTQIPMLGFPGTAAREEAIALSQIFSFPLGDAVEVAYRQPGDKDSQRATLTPDECESGAIRLYPANGNFPFLYEILSEGSIGYVRWQSFDDVALNIAGWEKFLGASAGRPAVIIDLRGNGGGLLSLMYTMASYLFPPAKAVSLRWLDAYDFDARTKSFVKSPGEADLRVCSPRPELAYTGAVVVLVNGDSASAAEFFAQFLQKAGRATVIAEEGTDGAGGIKRQVVLPGKMVFTYTGGQTFFAGTREVNLEGKGVTPDVRVPITEENERKKLQGEDVVLHAAIDYLKKSFPKTP
jgi:C-terminal processing protease CtpA/Prc